jgi:hypothetical protein
MLPPICCKPAEAPEISEALLPVQYRRADRIKCRRCDINGLVCSKQKCQSVQMGIAVFTPIPTPPTKKYGKQPPSLVSILMPFQAPRINTQLHTVPLPLPHFIASFLNPNTPPPLLPLLSPTHAGILLAAGAPLYKSGKSLNIFGSNVHALISQVLLPKPSLILKRPGAGSPV